VKPVVVRTAGGPGTGFPHTDDYYPALSRRIGEAGTAIVQVCVDGQGRLTSAPQVTHTSGYARLDQGALNLAQAGSGHYRPATEDGHPVSSCYPYRIKFELNN
jgi:periplasmic protein TonB